MLMASKEHREPIPKSGNPTDEGYYCDLEKDLDDEASANTDEAQNPELKAPNVLDGFRTNK
ncbi:hypothetical protein OROHE_019584 [Orobanche hederae]